MEPLGFFDPHKALIVRHGKLPHWHQPEGLYFVTFRLGDSLPAERLLQLERMIADGALLDGDPLESEWQKWLDARHGSCVLEIPCVRELVLRALRVFTGVRYELGKHVVAPNHVHVLIRTALDVDLSDVLHSWKSYTGHEILKIEAARLRFGRFATSGERPNVWQKESFDHLVRNAGSLERFEDYIRGHEARDR